MMAKAASADLPVREGEKTTRRVGAKAFRNFMAVVGVGHEPRRAALDRARRR